MVQHGGQRAFVSGRQGVERPLHSREQTRPRRLHLVRRHEPLGEQRDDGKSEAKRHEYGHRERRRKGGEKLPHHALQQAQRQEDHHGGEGGRGDGPNQLLDCRANGLQTLGTVLDEDPDELGKEFVIATEPAHRHREIDRPLGRTVHDLRPPPDPRRPQPHRRSLA